MVNVVLVTAHDLGRYLSIYGVRSVYAPNIEAFAGEAVVFNSHFTTAPNCSPARASIATGRYPHSNGVMGLAHHPFNWHLPESERHIASILRDNGYRTAIFGLQHVTGPEPGKTVEDKVRGLGFEELYLVSNPTALVVAPMVVEWLRRYGRVKPFYIEVNFFEVHRPWERYRMEYTRGVEPPRWLPPWSGYGRELAKLQGAIHVLDRGLGLIIRALKELKLFDDTLLIFTTDHGVDLPRAKATLYDPGIEATLIMSCPNCGIYGGRRINALTSHVDLLPTVLEVLGIKPPGNVQGVSLLPLIKGSVPSVRDAVYAEKTYHERYDPVRAIRTGRFKLIMHFEAQDTADAAIDSKLSPAHAVIADEITIPNEFVELYDLEKDPLELHDVSRDPDYEDVLRSLLRRLYEFLRDTNDPILNGPIPSPHYYQALRILKGEEELPPKRFN